MSSEALAMILANATPFGLPLATRFRSIDLREGVLLAGPSGWGEFTPFPEYDDQTAARWLSAAVEAAYGSWPAAKRDVVPVNAIVPAVSPTRAAELTYEAWVADGCSVIKIKVAEQGQTSQDDAARVSAVRYALADVGAIDPKIRIDANGAWTVDQALAAILELDAAAGGLEYVEQPCASLSELAMVRAETLVPIAADESIRTAADPLRAAQTGAADIVVIKVAPLGGVSVALRVAQAAQGAGIGVVVSGAMDSSVGLAGPLAVAAALDDLPYACGLGTGSLLGGDLVDRPVRPRFGVLPVVRTDPDPQALDRAQARLSPQRAAWWLDRLERAWAAGAQDQVQNLIT